MAAPSPGIDVVPSNRTFVKAAGLSGVNVNRAVGALPITPGGTRRMEMVRRTRLAASVPVGVTPMVNVGIVPDTNDGAV